MHPDLGSEGIGLGLIHYAEGICRSAGIVEIYLLTNTYDLEILKNRYFHFLEGNKEHGI